MRFGHRLVSVQDMSDQMWTVIPVLYRDAANHKKAATVLADGAINGSQLDALGAALESDEMFVPAQVGLRHLGATMAGFPGTDDHGWHEIDMNEIVVEPDAPNFESQWSPVIKVGPVADFVAKFVRAATMGWEPKDPND